jgi:5S rRNA maturation endonuclease (ribonuclease M5)
MSYDPAFLPTTQILSDYARIQRELRARDIVRTYNSPVGDIAEAIVAAHYGGTRGAFAQPGWDVLTPDGQRLQVKGMRRTATNRRRNLSVIRDADYDAVVIVILDEDYRVSEGMRLERETVEALFPHRDYVNGRIITVTQALRAYPGVEVLELSDALLDAPNAGQHQIH